MEVIIDGVHYLPSGASKVKAGDFVCLPGGIPEIGEENTLYGIVVAISQDACGKECVGVAFPRYNQLMHYLGGATSHGHGWWVKPQYLEVVP